jgi:hypothetical protein
MENGYLFLFCPAIFGVGFVLVHLKLEKFCLIRYRSLSRNKDKSFVTVRNLCIDLTSLEPEGECLVFKEISMSSCLLQDRTAFSLILALSTQKRLGDFSGRHADRFKSYCLNILFSFAVMLKEYTFTFYFRIFSCNENSFLNLYRKCLSPKFLIDCVHGTLHSSVSKL